MNKVEKRGWISAARLQRERVGDTMGRCDGWKGCVVTYMGGQMVQELKLPPPLEEVPGRGSVSGTQREIGKDRRSKR